MRALDFDFSGVSLRVAGLSEGFRARLEQEWERFLAPSPGAPLLQIEVGRTEVDATDRPFRPKEMISVFEASSAIFEMPQGRATVDAEGSARLELARDHERTSFWTMMNLLRACLAWRLPSAGAALLHAAGLVVEGRAFVLVGAPGSGKTTWARLGEQHGARLLSDDLVLVQRTPDAVEALGSPFRSSLARDYRPGRWPLAAILFPHHAERASWTACDRLRARARLAANLPFVAAALERDPRVAAVVETLATTVDCRDFHFALDGSFLELLRSRGGALDG